MLISRAESGSDLVVVGCSRYASQMSLFSDAESLHDYASGDSCGPELLIKTVKVVFRSSYKIEDIFTISRPK